MVARFGGPDSLAVYQNHRDQLFKATVEIKSLFVRQQIQRRTIIIQADTGFAVRQRLEDNGEEALFGDERIGFRGVFGGQKMGLHTAEQVGDAQHRRYGIAFGVREIPTRLYRQFVTAPDDQAFVGIFFL
ncbi:hypothetical protein AADEFJLK_04711 [Methylovulum psychrotolerans]|uniref:Uncharacterized protein n=1 Tax=Methylovulum psychrotolerans TaxID=1704499 RepID=A0A2S5CFL3_9GAMM|nr:hypothetical protein AADEFJLK_04711 [Methylovulum psychrotolerans]